MTTPNVFGIEGLDRLGKSTLIQGILDTLGYHQVIHFSKPQKLAVYEKQFTDFTGQLLTDECAFDENGNSLAVIPPEVRAVYRYQYESFKNSMMLATSGARIIFDRWHIGEVVYSPMYRNYSGEYVYDLEQKYGLGEQKKVTPPLPGGYEMEDIGVRLILLVEDFTVARHFVDDGQSLGTVDKRAEEQSRFVNAFHKSHIRDKRIVCVTDLSTGQFRSKKDILEEALR